MNFRFTLLVIAFFLTSCANYKMHHTKAVSGWNATFKSGYPSEQPQYVLYGIGDSGYLPSGEISPALTSMRVMMDKEVSPTGAVFMGDNIYPAGMPREGTSKRADAEEAINAQIGVVKDFDGDIIFMPGNHDWRQDDRQKGVRRQEDYIQDTMGKKVFHPNNGCSGPKDFQLSKDVVLIVFDSEWYLQNWDNQIDFNENCDYKTRADFIYELSDVIKKYAKDKRVIISMHHPLYTNGSHGGKFEALDYIMPLTLINEKLKIPLPVVGALYPLFRKNVGEREDVNGEKYKELRQKILAATDVFDNVIFLSGHEHNMQYIYREDHHHIVAGSGCKRTPVGMGEGAEFSYAELGFSRLSFFKKGETWVEFFACGNGEPRLVYARKLAEELTDYEPKLFEFVPPKKPYVEETIALKNTDKGGLYHFLMGKQYSALYNIPIKARVTNLSIKEGGLKAVKRGGGFQTNSLRLTDSKDRDWVMRAMKKDPTRLLPDEFVGTVAVDAVDHFLTSAHPLAAFTIPPMAQAIDILHTKPELLYIPKQEALGVFNEDHGDVLYLFEDRPDGNRKDRDNFGNSKKMISTDDLIEEMKSSGRHRPMQSDVIRNRLFDMIIGDWDRHDDQWRWAQFDGPGKTKLYRPVPRDRDQAFSIFEGPIVAIGRIFSPGIAKFQTFDSKIKNVEYFNFNARYFDRSFTNEMTWKDWEEQITHLQSKLTDEAIHQGVSFMQSDIYDLTGEELEKNIKARRDQLKKYSKKYYLSLAKQVEIHATNDDDLIEVLKMDGSLEVKISDLDKKGEKNYTYYQRIFSDRETKEVNIYGLDGDDEMVVSGSGSNIKLRLIGGTDNDAYINKGSSGKVHVYDYPQNSEISKTSGLNLHLTEDYSYNTYDRKQFKYNHSYAIPLIGFNPDNGLLLGGMFTGVWHGFKKKPYKASHSLSGLYSFETNGFKINYGGHFIDAIGKWNIKLGGLFQDKLFSNNFFGLGNNSINHQEDLGFEDDYNRVRNSVIVGKILLEKTPAAGASFFIGPKIEVREVEYTTDRFLASQFDPTNLLFQQTTYAGGEVGFKFRDTDNKVNPHQGVDFGIQADYLSDLDDLDITKTSLNVTLGVYFPVDNKENLIWAHRLSGGFTFSDKALFYHQQQIGGSNGLRGFRNERFTGGSAVVYNSDLRLRLFQFNSYFAPSVVGLHGGMDLGRVWLDNDPTIDSNKWHANFGGGIWLSPFDLALIKVSYFASGQEAGRLIIGLGFDF